MNRDSPAPLTGLPLGLSCAAILAANFMNILDTTIVAVSLPAITGSLSASPVQGTWIYTIYAVCMAVVLPLSGWLTRRFGEVLVFLCSVSLFTLTSWLCGMSVNFEMLILARAVQGFASGMMMPLSQTLIMRLMPGKTAVAMSLWSMTAAIPPVLGPLLGGYLTDQVSWPWIFYINIIPGVLILPIIWKWVRPFESSPQKLPIDRVGLGSLMIGVICLQLSLDLGHEHDWLSSPLISALLVAALLGGVMFFIWESEEPHPIVDLSLFRIRTFTISTLYIATFMGVFMVLMILPPIWFQTALGYTSTWAGIVLAPLALVPLLLMPALGGRMSQLNPRLCIAIGTLLFSYGIWSHGQLNSQIDISHLIFYRIILGLSMPFLWVPLMTLAYSDVPPAQLATASGIFNFARMAAASMGTAISVTLWQDRTVYHRSYLAESLDTTSGDAFEQLGALAAGDNLAALQLFEYQMMRQASTLGLNDVISAAAGVMLLLLLLVPLLPSKFAAQPGVAVEPAHA